MNREDHLSMWRAIRCARRSLQRVAYEHPTAIQTALVEVLRDFRRLDLLNNQITRARQHGLHAAAEVMCRRTEAALSDLETLIRAVRAGLPSQATLVPPPSHFASEMEQLDEEFGGFEFADGVLSMTTRPVTLGDPSVDLGTFRLELDLSRLDVASRGIPLRAKALQPNPATGEPHVTHPHISNAHVCLGEAVVPIKHALIQGRLADALLLVNSVLHHYNPDSPYVELAHWEGEACHDCGGSMNRDDSFYCEPCGHDFCLDCTGRCEGCDDTCCLSCLSRCSTCDDHACSGCSSPCKGCNEPTCHSCLDEDFCPGCITDEEEDEEEETAEPSESQEPPDPTTKEPSHEPTTVPPPPFPPTPHTPPVEAA